MRALLLAALALLACLSQLHLAAPAAASPNPIPVMSLALSPSGVTTSPDPVSPGFAQVTGTISIDKLPGERLSVSVTGTVDTGWQVQCSPSILLFTTNKITDFTATVVVPPGTPASMVGVLRVEAQAQGVGFFLRAVGQALVGVNPYFRVFLDSPMPFKEITPGARTSFILDVQNWGNSIDTFDIYVTNAGELADRGWLISFSTSSASRIGPMGSKQIRMVVQSPMVSTFWKAEATLIMVQATSQNALDAGTPAEQVFMFVVYERGFYFNELGYSLLALLVVTVALLTYGAVRWRRRRRRARTGALTASPGRGSPGSGD
ncbi:MAG: choice-of-anchor T family protein [Thermoplasmatota archaeon]